MEFLGKRKNIKYCPYRDNNCPYGDKCRFSHAEGKIFFPPNPKRLRRSGYREDNPKSVLADALAAFEGDRGDSNASNVQLLSHLPRYVIPVEQTLIQFDGNYDLRRSTVTFTVVDERNFAKIIEYNGATR